MASLPRLPDTVRPLLALALATALPAAGHAAGMTLTMQNAAHLGHAFSGGAAAEDASTNFFNPAGLVRLEGAQFVVGGNYVLFGGTFTNTGSTTGGLFPTPGADERDLGLDKLVPNLHVAYPLSPTMALGFGVSAPFGLGTSYEPGWVGRYHALHSELRTVNLNPSFAWKASESLSLGVGFNWQTVEATLSNAIDFGLIGFLQGIPGLVPNAADGALRLEADDATPGFNFGAHYDVQAGTRIGVHYRSKMAHRLTGRATFANVPGPLAPLFPAQDVRADLTLPESFSISFVHEFSPSLALLGDWSRWKWSRLDRLAIDFADPLTPDSAQPFGWKDASIYSLGLRWRTGDRHTWRAGLAYNESPVPSPELRTARVPDSDRVWVAFGYGVRFSGSVRGDFGYARLFFKDGATANDDGLGHTLVGLFEPKVDIVSAQLTWDF